MIVEKIKIIVRLYGFTKKKKSFFSSLSDAYHSHYHRNKRSLLQLWLPMQLKFMIIFYFIFVFVFSFYSCWRCILKKNDFVFFIILAPWFTWKIHIFFFKLTGYANLYQFFFKVLMIRKTVMCLNIGRKKKKKANKKIPKYLWHSVDCLI